MSRLSDVETLIVAAPAAGVSLDDLAATMPDARPRSVAPLAWWLTHTGRVAMSPDCTRWRAHTCAAGCGTRLDPFLITQGWTMHPACEYPQAGAA